MSDPFSLATGLVGLVGIAIQVTQVIIGFIAQRMDVPKDTNNFMLELLALKTQLSELYTNLVLNLVFANAFQDQNSTLVSQLAPEASSTSDAELILKVYVQEMEALAKELQKRARGSRFGHERLKRLPVQWTPKRLLTSCNGIAKSSIEWFPSTLGCLGPLLLRKFERPGRK
jgi:hypothetical protein